MNNRSDDARVVIKSLFMSGGPTSLSIYSLHGSGHCAVEDTLLHPDFASDCRAVDAGHLRRVVTFGR